MAGESDKKNTVKLAIAVLALLIGGGLIANSMGAFDSIFSKPAPPPELPAEILKEHEETKKKTKQKIDSGELPPPAGA